MRDRDREEGLGVMFRMEGKRWSRLLFCEVEEWGTVSDGVEGF